MSAVQNKMVDAEGGKLDLSQLRNLVRQYIDNHLYKTAQFWADKVCTLSKNNSQDVLWLAHTLFLTNQYLRAAQLLKSNGLILTNNVAKYLAARCYFECKDWRSALEILEGESHDLKIDSQTVNNVSNPSNSNINNTYTETFFISGGNRKIQSSIALLKGMIYEALENREIAIQCFKDALQHDVYCYEAFEMLVSHNALSMSEETQLLETLPFLQQCNPEEAKLVKVTYGCKINKYAKPVETKLPEYLEVLNENLDYVVSLAERHFNNCNYRDAFKYTSIIINADPLHEACLPLYISCLVELKMKNELYNTAHRLVNTYPSRSVSWYAIGAYYLLINKNEAARKYFSKATAIDNNFGPAWLGFAHSFACEGERDQAISAYYSASKLMPGSHLPYLYLGLEYSLSNNMKLATKFYKEALAIAPDDPHIKHELGSLSYQNGEYQQAEGYFLEALNRIQIIESNIKSDIWEPLYNNLGHTSRKLKKFGDAIAHHEKAFLLNPRNSGTCSAIGLCYMLQDNYEKAISLFHKALSLKRDDTVTIQLLTQSLDSLSNAETESPDIAEESKMKILCENVMTINNSNSNSLIDLSCDSQSLSVNNTIEKSDVDSSTIEMEDTSRMSLEMSDIGTPL